MRRLLTAIILIVTPLMSSAQKMLTASGEYTYYAPQNITIEQAKSIAVERAKIGIIADHFGTIVGVNNSTTVSNVNGESSVSFLSIGDSEVKVEWIETIGEPKFSISFEQNMQVINVKIKGTIREIKAVKVPFTMAILKNGIEDKYESEEFRDGDHLYVAFETPVSGYVSIYLYDQSGVSRLLPMKHQSDGSQFVEQGEKYVFFARKGSRYSPELGRNIENLYSEYTLFCSDDNELNRLYVVFSPNKYSRPIDNTAMGNDMPAMLSFESFQSWLTKSRKQDVDMCLKIKDIIIRKQ